MCLVSGGGGQSPPNPPPFLRPPTWARLLDHDGGSALRFPTDNFWRFVASALPEIQKDPRIEK